jgi:pimeloyl-ACP methyl ester carboxylesterase
MPVELIEDAKGDYRNCRALAVASNLAYLPEPEGVDGFRSQVGLEARRLSAGSTQAYVATNENHIVVAFRGTESPNCLDGLRDCLLTDAADLLILPEGDLGTDFVAAGVGAKFHMGFIRALAAIWDALFAAVDAERKQNGRPIWITGHSLGGALAMLAAWRFKRKFVPVHQIYTFGAPMIGNDLAAGAFEREFPDRIFRYVNFPDPVPMLPTVSLIANHYCHCGKEMMLGAVTAGGATTDFFKQMAGKTIDGILNATLIDDIWKGLQDRMSAHFLDNYQKLIGEVQRQV